jgi:hypothetical protein
MTREELQHLNKRPIRIRVTGWIDSYGTQVVGFSVLYRAHRYVVSYAFPPEVMAHIPHLGLTAQAGLRRAWRRMREGLRKAMHGDNFRERRGIERRKRLELANWDRFNAPLVPPSSLAYERRKFVASLEERAGPTPPYTGHDYSRRVDDEHRREHMERA